MPNKHQDHDSACWLNTPLGGLICTCPLSKAHKWGCAVGIGGSCNCMPQTASPIWVDEFAPIGFDDEPTLVACMHEPAKDPLWHEGAAWIYCKDCGEWLKLWTGLKTS